MTLRTLLFGAILIPLTLLLGALGFQVLGGLAPCELCVYQRWPHAIAAGLALLGVLALPRNQGLAKGSLVLSALALGTSGGIAVFHSGVERKWWPGPGCAASVDPSLSPEDYLKQITEAAVVNCSDIPWSLFGLSMANYNALISIGVSLGLLALVLRPSHSR